MLNARRPFTVAIMQPYFLPYAGYFRLLAASDLFVIYDCVQFPRRGWVHRNRLIDARGAARWLTLPLEKAPRTIRIKDLLFPANASARFADRLRLFGLEARTSDIEHLLTAVRDVRGRPVDYLERLLAQTADYLRLPWTVLRSSTLNIPATVRGQQRILAIAKRLGARRYVNPPGGRDLYDGDAFAGAGIDLCFLEEYPGPSSSILTRVTQESRDELVRDIRASSQLRDWSDVRSAVTSPSAPTQRATAPDAGSSPPPSVGVP